MNIKFFLLCLLFLAFAVKSVCSPADSLNEKTRKKRLIYVTGISAAAYTGTIIGLDKIWYSRSTRTKFHFFNDNKQWCQLDKCGHFYSSFYLSTAGIDLLKWAGLSEKKAILLDNILGLALLTPIEILDGHSSAYGASWGDEVADAAGDLFVLGQYALWKEMVLYPKFSFHPTSYAKLRPNVLGSNLVERSIKDYNGQTYWMSVPIKKWLHKESKFPAWLNIAVGYGAKNMIYGDPEQNRAHGYTEYRQIFLSPDIAFRKIKVKSKAVKTLFYMLDLIHMPLPALEYNHRQGIVFHPLYF